jgi:hypothetical protein
VTQLFACVTLLALSLLLAIFIRVDFVFFFLADVFFEETAGGALLRFAATPPHAATPLASVDAT